MGEREKFEAWISAPPFEKSVARHPESNRVCWPGQYHSLDVELAWESWQEARKQEGVVRCSERLQKEMLEAFERGESSDHYNVLRDFMYESGLKPDNEN